MTIIDLDARKAQRRRVLDTGLIRFGDTSISCAIRNVSNGGLALDVGSQVGIPDQFTLFVVRNPIRATSPGVRAWIGVVFC
jgi:hypothetical protein